MVIRGEETSEKKRFVIIKHINGVIVDKNPVYAFKRYIRVYIESIDN